LMLITTQGLLYSHAIRKKMAKGKIEDALYGRQIIMFYHAQEQQQIKRF